MMTYPGENGRIAIMQPYLFPYLGYFQLMSKVDAFWLLDTAQFVKRGWMNRNNVFCQGEKTLFSIPVERARRDALIFERKYATEAPIAFRKLLLTLENSYSKAPYIENSCAMVEHARHRSIQNLEGADFTELTEFALRNCADHIGVTTPIKRISSLGLDTSLSGQDRIIAACQMIGAREYLNMAGGRDLYSDSDFESAGVKLLFLHQDLLPYSQGTPHFEPGLSILDAIAHVAPEDFPRLISAGTIV